MKIQLFLVKNFFFSAYLLFILTNEEVFFIIIIVITVSLTIKIFYDCYIKLIKKYQNSMSKIYK